VSDREQGGSMPFITVLTLGGRTLEQRRAFAAAVTQLATECLDASPREVRVRFVEMDAGHFARSGRLAADGSADAVADATADSR